MTKTEATEPEVLPAEEPATEPAPKKNGRPPGKKDGNTARVTKQNKTILELHTKKVPMRQIAKATDLPLSTVRDRIAKFSKVFEQLENVPDYREMKSSLLSAAELALLKSAMDPSKLDKASVNNLAYAFTQFNMANRLERGESTANVSKIQFTKVDITSYEDD